MMFYEEDEDIISSSSEMFYEEDEDIIGSSVVESDAEVHGNTGDINQETNHLQPSTSNIDSDEDDESLSTNVLNVGSIDLEESVEESNPIEECNPVEQGNPVEAIQQQPQNPPTESPPTEEDPLDLLLRLMKNELNLPVVPYSTIFLAKIHQLLDVNYVKPNIEEDNKIRSFIVQGKNVIYTKIVYVGFFGIIDNIFEGDRKDIWYLAVKDEEKPNNCIWCRIKLDQTEINRVEHEYNIRKKKFIECEKQLTNEGVESEDYDEAILLFSFQKTRKALLDKKVQCCFTLEDYYKQAFLKTNNYKVGSKVFITGKLALIERARIVYLNSVKFFDDDTEACEREEAVLKQMIQNRDT